MQLVWHIRNLYSGDRPLGLFAWHLIENLKEMNRIFENIIDIFESSGISNFEKLPEDIDSCRKFAKDFKEFNAFLEAAKIQGFKWSISSYTDDTTQEKIDVAIDEETYLILVLRYKELEEPLVPAVMMCLMIWSDILRKSTPD